MNPFLAGQAQGFTGTALTPLFNGAGETVACLMDNPAARFVQWAPGTCLPSFRNRTSLGAMPGVRAE